MNSKRRFINVNYTMSYEEHEEGFTMPEFHLHNDYEIYILERGNRVVSIGEITFVTEAGDAVLFASEEPHKSKGNEGFAGICIHFSERYLKTYFAGTAIDMFKEVFSHKKLHISAENRAIIRKMTEEFVIDDEDNFLRLAEVFAILRTEAKRKLEGTAVNTSVHREKKRVTEIFSYVEENYAYIKTVAELSERFEVSESYIFRIFKQRYGMTPKTYINKLRIKNVCRMLKYQDNTIKNAAQECGFESYEYFSRVFKKKMGCTPAEYCRECRK